MSVITDTYSDHCGTVTGRKGKCSVCGGSLYRYPFLHWFGAVEIFICADCCKTIKAGLIADLVHVVAINNLQDAESIYKNYTLVRKQIKELEADGKRREHDNGSVASLTRIREQERKK